MIALLSFVAGPIGRWVVVAILVCAAVAAAGMRAYNAGYAKHEAETLAEVAEANSKARAAERAASERMAKVVSDHEKEATLAKMETVRLRADVRSGARRLSVVTAGLSACPDSGAAGGTGAETRTELAGSVTEALVSIASDGDAAIRQSNALIEAYQLASEVCGK